MINDVLRRISPVGNLFFVSSPWHFLNSQEQENLTQIRKLKIQTLGLSYPESAREVWGGVPGACVRVCFRRSLLAQFSHHSSCLDRPSWACRGASNFQEAASRAHSSLPSRLHGRISSGFAQTARLDSRPHKVWRGIKCHNCISRKQLGSALVGRARWLQLLAALRARRSTRHLVDVSDYLNVPPPTWVLFW